MMEHEFVLSVVCPECGNQDNNDPVFEGEETQAETYCDSCGVKMLVTRMETTVYTTEVL